MSITLLYRELNNFLNSLMGTIVVSVFLIITGLFLWVFPGPYNIMESGYANLQGLFNLAPFVFLFIIPAITMRFFADEARSGTIEMLLTKPITDTHIILSKWMAGFVLVVFTLFPTLIYFLTVSVYASAPGVDTGGTWGSYLGLLFIGGAFVSIGLFASSLTENQIVSFVLALLLSGFAYIGFEMIHALGFTGRSALFIRNLGIQAHYVSMSRGVIDSRDVLYFFSLTGLFLLVTKIKLESRKWGAKTLNTGTKVMPTRDLRYKHLTHLLLSLICILALNLIGSVKFTRFDLTAEKRHSLTSATKNMLSDLEDIVYVRVFLDGEFPAGFRRLRNQTREVLDEFRAYSDMIQYEFINPARSGDSKQVQDYYDMLIGKGLQPAQIQVRADDASSQQIIFPAALMSYGDKEIPVQLLQDHIGLPIEEMLNNSAQLLEYVFINAIKQLTSESQAVVAFLEGHGTLENAALMDIKSTLSKNYRVHSILLDRHIQVLDGINTLIVAKPTSEFLEPEKFILDQFIMQGGSVLWLLDPVFASMDSIQYNRQETIGIAWPLNLDDMMFQYGLRLNANLVMDLQSAPIAVTTGSYGNRPQISLIPWPFFPLLSPTNLHPIVKNINLVRSEFVSSLDTVEVPDVRKTLLLETSAYSRIMPVPVLIDLRILQEPVDERLYAGPPKAVAALLEGRFTSLFRNRIIPEGINLGERKFFENSVPNAMIVVSDGDIIKNQISNTGQAFPLGYDRYSGDTFGNKDFIVNAVNYLTDASGIMAARNKEIRLRMLNMTKMNQNTLGIQLLNLLLPLAFVFFIGLFRIAYRKWRYSRTGY